MSAIIVGAGIVGLAVARALAIKGYEVRVFERTAKAVGASIRNFGMVWPIGQPSGEMFEIATRSRDIWKEIGDSGAFWYDPVGSLHLAYEKDEWTVLEEIHNEFKKERNVKLMPPGEILKRSGCVVQKNLKGGLYSGEEIIVDPRKAIAAVPEYLNEKYGTRFHWNESVNSISGHTVELSSNEKFRADIIFLCSGSDIETLYPEIFKRTDFTKCKLQMMRLATQTQNSRIGPALCGGLSLIHYNSFKAASSLPALKQRFTTEMKEYLDWGIHVMVSQNQEGELTIGDSHEYGTTLDPFNKTVINTLILDYLKAFADFQDWSVKESWDGTYLKQKTGEPFFHHSINSNVHILNALGGAGMTLSFGLAEKIVHQL